MGKFRDQCRYDDSLEQGDEAQAEAEGRWEYECNESDDYCNEVKGY